MFEELIEKFDTAVRNLRGIGKISEKNIADSLREIRRVLLEADVNFRVVKDFIARIQEKAVGDRVLKSVTPGQQVVKIVHEELIDLLGRKNEALKLSQVPPTVIMIVGLQGSGKTTFSAKLALYLKKSRHYPLLVAADMQRPAAVEQLLRLGESADIPVFHSQKETAVNVARLSLKEARKNSHDFLILDTAGRLHLDADMMAEVSAIKGAVRPAEILFVADGMTGQDAVRSASAFQEELDFSGIVLTKLDGDTKGGAALSIRAVTGKPIKFISAGEKLEDLEVFHPDRMASRILGMGDVLTLVEKAQEHVDRAAAEKLDRKVKKAELTLEDFLDQLHQVRKMGPLNQLAGMLPGVGGKLKNVQMDESALDKVEAIIKSMTREEKQHPQIINGSRRKRVAQGSGTSIQDVNRLLKQFRMMQKMAKQLKHMGPGGMPAGFPLGM